MTRMRATLAHETKVQRICEQQSRPSIEIRKKSPIGSLERKAPMELRASVDQIRATLAQNNNPIDPRIRWSGPLIEIPMRATLAWNKSPAELQASVNWGLWAVKWLPDTFLRLLVLPSGWRECEKSRQLGPNQPKLPRCTKSRFETPPALESLLDVDA